MPLSSNVLFESVVPNRFVSELYLGITGFIGAPFSNSWIVINLEIEVSGGVKSKTLPSLNGRFKYPFWSVFRTTVNAILYLSAPGACWLGVPVALSKSDVSSVNWTTVWSDLNETEPLIGVSTWGFSINVVCVTNFTKWPSTK